MNLISSRIIILFHLIIFLPIFNASSQEIAVFENLEEKLSLTRNIAWYKDVEGTTSANEAMDLFKQGLFTPNSDIWMRLGLIDEPLWLVCTIQNNTTQNDLVLELRNPRLAYADLYLEDGQGSYRVIENGLSRSYNMRPINHPMPSYPFNLEPGDQTTILFRIQDTGDIQLRLWLWGYPAFTNRAATAYYPEMIGIGVFLILAILHFILFFALRDKAFLYLGLHISSWLLFNMSVDGTGHKLLWRDLPWVAERITATSFILMLASFLMFTSYYLNTRQHAPKLYNAVRLVMGLCVIHLTGTAISNASIQMELARILAIITITLSVVLVIHAIKQGSRMARYFAASWIGALLCGVVILALNMYWISPDWFMGTPLITFLFSSSVFLWSFQLTARLRAQARKQRKELEQHVETLTGLLPICANCKKIRDDGGNWSEVEVYVGKHTEASFSHDICPVCVEILYPGMLKK